MKSFLHFLRHESGAMAIEYAAIACFMSIMIVVGATATGSKVSKDYSSIAAAV
jgi:Flp pilus assembly pilin Flp